MGGMAEEKEGASALSSSSSRSATSHSDDKTEAKSATRRTSSGKQSTSRTTSPRKRTTAKTPRASRTTKAATAAAVANGEVPAQSIPVADPSQFGRIAVMDVTPNEESGRFPARVELGEPFKVTAQVFIEGRTKVGATAIVRNHRGKEMQRLPMTCTNPASTAGRSCSPAASTATSSRGSPNSPPSSASWANGASPSKVGGHLQVLAA